MPSKSMYFINYVVRRKYIQLLIIIYGFRIEIVLLYHQIDS